MSIISRTAFNRVRSMLKIATSNWNQICFLLFRNLPISTTHIIRFSIQHAISIAFCFLFCFSYLHCRDSIADNNDPLFNISKSVSIQNAATQQGNRLKNISENHGVRSTYEESGDVFLLKYSK